MTHVDTATADFVASKAGQLGALMTAIATQISDLGSGTPQAQEDLTDLIYLAEGLARTVRKYANELAASLAKQNPGS